MRFLRRYFWHILQGAAAIALAALVTVAPKSGELANYNPATLAIWAAVAGAAIVFAISYLVEIVFADVRTWRLAYTPERRRTELAMIVAVSMPVFVGIGWLTGGMPSWLAIAFIAATALLIVGLLLRHQGRQRATTPEILLSDRLADNRRGLAEQSRRDGLHILERPAHRKALKQRPRGGIGDDPRQ